MGIEIFDKNLTTSLFSKTRRGLMASLFGRPNETFYVNQLMQITCNGSGDIQRELKFITEAGVLKRTQSGNQIYYQANSQCPIFEKPKIIVKKSLVSNSFPLKQYSVDELIHIDFRL